MPYSPGHKPKTKQKILQAASRLFAAKGYAGTSIDEIMQACGLTRGGFYAHFSSKAELYRNACVHRDLVNATLGEYLETGKPVSADLASASAFLAVDVASKTPEVRAAFTDAFMCISDKLLTHFNAEAQATESCSLSTAALIVGALAVAHTTDNPSLKQKLLASCRENVRTLLGGGDPSTPAFFWEPAQ
jgi:AcrR family transcriptional regulator